MQGEDDFYDFLSLILKDNAQPFKPISSFFVKRQAPLNGQDQI